MYTSNGTHSHNNDELVDEVGRSGKNAIHHSQQGMYKRLQFCQVQGLLCFIINVIAAATA